MKYSFWDNLFERTYLKLKIERLTENESELKEELEKTKRELEIRNEQVVQSVDVAKIWKNKFDSLSSQVQREKEEIKKFLQENSIVSKK